MLLVKSRLLESFLKLKKLSYFVKCENYYFVAARDKISDEFQDFVN